MNVCLANDSFPPIIDGVANTVVNYADIIQRKYGTATVLVPSYPDVVDDYPYEVIRYPSFNTMKSVGYRTGYPLSNIIIEKTEGKKIDIIHSHCPAISTFASRLLRSNTDAPIVMTYHTKFDIDIQRTVKGKMIREIAMKLFSSNIAACDEVWTVSNGAGENMRKLGYDGDYIIMKNGVDFPKSRVSEDDVKKLAAEYRIPEGIPVFLFVGRMVWYKGQKITLDALAKLKNDGWSFRMIFVGDGSDKDEIVKYTEELGLTPEVIFVGALHDRYLLRTFFCLSDAFLFPSTFDTNGIVVREAAACSLPSVIIRGSCVAEDVTDGQNGIFIDEDSGSMAAVLEKYLKEPEKLKRIGENAANEIYMSWEDAVAAAVKRYEVVTEKYRSKPKKRMKDRAALDDFMSFLSKSYEDNYQFRREIEKFKASLREFISSSDNTDRYL